MKFDTPITHEVYVECSPETVFDCITSSKGWDAFFTEGMTLELREGGLIHFRWKNWGPEGVSAEDVGTILKFVRPSEFTFQWYPAGKDNPTIVTLSMAQMGKGTVVSLHEDGYPDSPEGRKAFNNCATGWGEALTLLKFYLEKGITYQHPTQ